MTWSAGKPAYSNTSSLSEKKVGRIVSMHFFWGLNLFQDVHQGLFTSMHDWITSHLTLSKKDCQSTLENSPSFLEQCDEDDADNTMKILDIIGNLKLLLLSFFPPKTFLAKIFLFMIMETKSQHQRDSDLAVRDCDNAFFLHDIYVDGLITSMLGWTTLGACAIEMMRIKAAQLE